MIKNIIANYIGKFWALISGFIFIPFYIQILGFSSYSIISFTLIIASVMMVIDSGLSASLSREFSRSDIETSEKKNAYRTLETIFLLIILLVFFLIFLFSPNISKNFVSTNSYSSKEIELFLKILGFDIAGQMLFRFYIGGLLGLEKQVLANKLQIAWSLFRNLFLIIIIFFFPKLDIFFLWQAIITIVFSIIVKLFLEKHLFGKWQFRFELSVKKQALNRVLLFSSGMLLISLVAAINTQLDKIIISKLLPIETLGYYTLGVSVSLGIIALINPISVAILPRFTYLFSAKRNEEAINLFILLNNIIGVFLFSFMSIVALNSENILFAWTNNKDISHNAHKFLTILCIGNSMLALQILPFTISIANGKTALNNLLGIISIIITIPGYILITKYYGAEGVAFLYSGVQIILTFIYIYFINKLFINTGFYIIFIKCLLIPFVTTFILALSFYYIFSNFIYNRIQFLFLFSFEYLTITLIASIILIKLNDLKKLKLHLSN